MTLPIITERLVLRRFTTSDTRGSRRVMERLGMRREGQFREAAFREGEWLDVLIYGMLADEWSCCVEHEHLTKPVS
jgi:L-amino acid N-acyltransferase YncA